MCVLGVVRVRPIAFPSVGPDKGEVGRRSVLAREAVTVPAHRVSAHPSRCLAVSLRSSRSIYLSIYLLLTYLLARVQPSGLERVPVHPHSILRRYGNGHVFLALAHRPPIALRSG